MSRVIKSAKPQDEASGTPNNALPPVRVHIIHRENCEYTEKLMTELQKEIPTSRISDEISDEEGVFEYFINDKLFFSKLNLGHFPQIHEMVEIAYWANKGKSFMHMYLCTVAEGGEPNMAIADRKKTPLPKRMLLACVIS